jgi:hypothetical protein
VNPSAAKRFFSGMALGVACGLVALVAALRLPGIAAQPAAWQDLGRNIGVDGVLDWIGGNLGLSLLPFSLTLVLFLISLGRLKRRLHDGSPPHGVAQADQLTDVWIGLFFGIGVLWTAIGMRSALLYALGNGVEAIAGSSPAGLLERLVHGGILTALTTTIVGGAGGYLLRLYKTVHVGGALKQFYGEVEQKRITQVETLLQEIRDRLGPQEQETGRCP